MPPREHNDIMMSSSSEVTTCTIHFSSEEEDIQEEGLPPIPLSEGINISLWGEAREQFKTAYPTLIGMAVSKIPWLISLRFVGGIGSTELAAAALATTLCNVTGLSLSVGLSSALTTLTGQARGELQARSERTRAAASTMNTTTTTSSSIQTDEASIITEQDDVEMEGLLTSSLQPNNITIDPVTAVTDNHRRQSTTTTRKKSDPLMPLVYLYRGILIQLACVIPVGCWWLSGIETTLISLGQGEELSALTQDYLRILALQLWTYSLCWTLTAWLQAMEMAFVPAYAAVAVLITHIPLNLFYIHVLNWGFLGCAAATVTTQSLNLFYVAGYIFGTSRGRQKLLQNMHASAAGRRTLSFVRESRIAIQWSGVVQYLGLALPGVIIISEWWASEISIFLSGTLSPSPDLALGGMTLYQSINSFCFMFPVACSVAGATRVSNLLGAGLDHHASFASHVSIGGAALVSGTIGSILYLSPHTLFPSFFAPDEKELVEEASRTIPLLATYVFADGIQTALNGSVKGCGRQVIIVPIVIIAYWVVGLPLAYYFAFVRNEGEMVCDDGDYFCGDVGLVAGMTTGTWVHMLLLAVTVLCFTDWKLEALKAYERVRGGDDLDHDPTIKTVELCQLHQQDARTTD